MVVYGALRNIFQLSLNWNTVIRILENGIENVIYKIYTILP